MDRHTHNRIREQHTCHGVIDYYDLIDRREFPVMLPVLVILVERVLVRCSLGSNSTGSQKDCAAFHRFLETTRKAMEGETDVAQHIQIAAKRRKVRPCLPKQCSKVIYSRLVSSAFTEEFRWILKQKLDDLSGVWLPPHARSLKEEVCLASKVHELKPRHRKLCQAAAPHQGKTTSEGQDLQGCVHR